MANRELTNEQREAAMAFVRKHSNYESWLGFVFDDVEEKTLLEIVSLAASAAVVDVLSRMSVFFDEEGNGEFHLFVSDYDLESADLKVPKPDEPTFVDVSWFRFK